MSKKKVEEEIKEEIEEKIIEESDEKEEEIVRPAEEEEYITVNKKIIYVIAILFIILLIGTLIYVSHKEKIAAEKAQEEFDKRQKLEQEERKKKKEELDKKAVEHIIPKIAVLKQGEVAKLFLLDEYSNILWQKDLNKYWPAIGTNQNYLYFQDNDLLHRLDINTLKLETFETISVKETKFYVEENYVFLPYSLTFINLTDSTRTYPDLSSGCNDYSSAYLLDHKFFCSRNHEDLISYNTTTKMIMIIDTGTIDIIDASKSWILYKKTVDKMSEYYMYNIYSGIRQKIPIPETNDYLHPQLFENNVYYRIKNIIYRFNGKETIEYYTFSLKEKQSLADFRILLNSRILIETNTFLPCYNCERERGCICDSSYITLYVANTEKGKTQEIDREIYDHAYAFSNIYYFYE